MVMAPRPDTTIGCWSFTGDAKVAASTGHVRSAGEGSRGMTAQLERLQALEGASASAGPRNSCGT